MTEIKIVTVVTLLLLALTAKRHDLGQLRASPDPFRLRTYLHYLRSSVLFGVALCLGLQIIAPELPLWSILAVYPILIVAYDSEYRGLVKAAELE